MRRFDFNRKQNPRHWEMKAAKAKSPLLAHKTREKWGTHRFNLLL